MFRFSYPIIQIRSNSELSQNPDITNVRPAVVQQQIGREGHDFPVSAEINHEQIITENNSSDFYGFAHFHRADWYWV